MPIYLGLGSNLPAENGGRRAQLEQAISLLQGEGFKVTRTSSVIETPALLPENANPDWLKPYLNCVVEGDTALNPAGLLAVAKKIEKAMGRDLNAPRWSPRPVDIDILVWEGVEQSEPQLSLPHPQAHKRAFVLTPLTELRPDLRFAGKTALQHSESVKPVPLWMGILNATPDSFSNKQPLGEGARLQARLKSWLDAGVHWVDIGAESTRPGGEAVPPEEEWQRLAPVVEAFQNALKQREALRPRLSVDTRHATTAAKAIEAGADAINDVSGLQDKEMLAVVRESGVEAIAMHSLSLPVVPGEHLPTNQPAIDQLVQWVEQSAEKWLAAGLNLNRILIDPGIGFGKTVLQNLELLESAHTLRKQGFRLLIGHSRKSFMNPFSKAAFADRDMETLGISLALAAKGVDILRVHEPLYHLRAHRAWSHITT